MNKLYQLYIFITTEGWENTPSVKDTWDRAPTVGDYKMLVITQLDLPKIKEDFPGADFRELGSDTLGALQAGELGPLVCTKEEASAIVKHFTPEETP